MPGSPWVALEATSDRRELARELIREHRRAMEGAVELESVRSVVRDSWKRSAAAGVDPSVRSAPVRLTDDEARDRLQAGLLALAPPVLRRLREDLQGEDEQVALLCDANGTILWIEGDPRVLDRAHEIRLEPGAEWSESAVGTNAMGTALAVDHPVQIFSAEHFAEPVHEWTCAAAPLHDPDTGEKIGVIDLSGGLNTAHPHSLALISTAARMIETMTLRERREQDERLRSRFESRIGHGTDALIGRRGLIVEATVSDWIGRRLEVPSGGGAVRWQGRAFVAEPVADGEGHLLVRASRAARTELRIDALGRDHATVTIGSRKRELSPRHSELLLALALRPEGMTADELAVEVWGERAKPVSARAELSRLRRVLGSHLDAGPYRLRQRARTDFDSIKALIEEGRLGAALDRYPGPIMPRSEVPIIVEARQCLEDDLRDAISARRDPALLERWLAGPTGEDDVILCRELVGLLPEGDHRRSTALSHLRRITARSSR